MRVKFKYNGITYYPKDPDKKLKQLGITWDDVEIIKEEKIVKPIELMDNKLYYFINNIGQSITSINPECPVGFTETTKEDLQKIWLANKMKKSINMLNDIWNMINDLNLKDSQECLDWLDKINEISIRN